VHNGGNMAKEWAKWFYRSKEWLRCREGYIDLVDSLCEQCKKNNRIKPGKILHHKEELTPDNIHDTNISLNWDNLEFLCQDCHNKETFRTTTYEVTNNNLMFNDLGELVLKK